MSLPKNKEELVSDLHTQIDGASRKIDELKLHTKLARADAKDALKQRIASLEQSRDKLKGDLERLKNSTGDAWRDLAEGCQRSWNEIKDAVSRAVDEFKS